MTGETLMLQTGGLIMGPGGGAARHHGKDDFVRRSIAVAEKGGIAVETLEAREIAGRFPQFILRGDEIGCYEPTAGLVFPERCIDVQLRLARQEGATTHLDEAVTAIRAVEGGVEVTTRHRVVQAARAVLTAGPWLPALAGDRFAAVAKVYRQTLHWFAADEAAFAPGRFPVFIWMHGENEEDYFYGFPALPGSFSVKLASERYAEPVDPNAVDRAVPTAESNAVFERHVSGRLRGVDGHVIRAAACLYTVTPDAGFIIDALPDYPDVLAASACSGHGFKHSAAVGELLAARALGDGPSLPATFALNRLNGLTPVFRRED
jgi:sarcosine oxidase